MTPASRKTSITGGSISSSIHSYGFAYGNDDLTEEYFEAIAAQAEVDAAAKLQQRANLLLSHVDRLDDSIDKADGATKLDFAEGVQSDQSDETRAGSRSSFVKMKIVIGSERNATQSMKADVVVEDKKMTSSDVSNRKKMEMAMANGRSAKANRRDQNERDPNDGDDDSTKNVRSQLGNASQSQSPNFAEYRFEDIDKASAKGSNDGEENNAQRSVGNNNFTDENKKNNKRAFRSSKKMFGSIVKGGHHRVSLDAMDTADMTATDLRIGVSGSKKGGVRHSDSMLIQGRGTSSKHVDLISSILYKTEM